MKNLFNFNQQSMNRCCLCVESVLSLIQSRLDSVSKPSRCRVFAKYAATMALFLCLGVGQM